MRTFLILTVDGVTNGFIYATVALALVMIWRATRVVNYAQGAMGMFTTYIALFAISHGVTYWLAFVIAIGGRLRARRGRSSALVVRPVESRPALNVVILTLGLLIFLEALAPMLFGGQVKSFPAPFSRVDLSAGGTQLFVSPFDIFVVGAVLLTMVGLLLFFQRTTIGLRMRAAAFGPEIARLLGVRVGRMLMLGLGPGRGARRARGTAHRPGRSSCTPTTWTRCWSSGSPAPSSAGWTARWARWPAASSSGSALSYVGGYLGSDLETIGGPGHPHRGADGATAGTVRRPTGSALA